MTNELTTKLRGPIECKMRVEEAVDVSDAEIERCVSGCALPTKLIHAAKLLRNQGNLIISV